MSDARIQLLLDKDEIRELVILYAHRIIAHDWRGISNLFTEDGVLDYSDVVTFARPAKATQGDPGATLVFVGRKAIGDFLPAVGRLDVKAFFTNHLVRVTGDDAVGISCFENRLTQQGESVIGAGRMVDEYRKLGGRWLISYRRQELFYFTGLHEGWAEGADRDRRPAPIAKRGWEDELLAGWRPGS
jgi:SnoaL-like protein